MAYDSKTDRADFSGEQFDTDRPWHLRSQAGYNDPKGKRALKRAASKRDRRGAFPRRGFRGYGYGDSNLSMNYW